MKNSTNSYTDSFKVAFFLYKWRKPLAILGLAAALLAAVFSSPFFITPLFKSTVIMYPASSNSISKSLLNENAIAKQDILEFRELASHHRNSRRANTKLFLHTKNTSWLRSKLGWRVKCSDSGGSSVYSISFLSV